MFSPPRHQGHQAHPPILSNAKTQRRKGACARLPYVARSRPFDDGREPLGRATALNASVRYGVPAQRPALCERRPRLFFPLFVGWEEPVLLSYRKKERQTRRAAGAPAGEKRGGNERLRSEQAGFSPATGDRPIVCRSAVNKRNHFSGLATASLRLCVFAPLRFLRWGDGSALICVICGFFGCAGGSAPLRFSWCSPLVSWCLGGAETLAFLA